MGPSPLREHAMRAITLEGASLYHLFSESTHFCGAFLPRVAAAVVAAAAPPRCKGCLHCRSTGAAMVALLLRVLLTVYSTKLRSSAACSRGAPGGLARDAGQDARELQK